MSLDRLVISDQAMRVTFWNTKSRRSPCFLEIEEDQTERSERRHHPPSLPRVLNGIIPSMAGLDSLSLRLKHKSHRRDPGRRFLT